MISRASRLASAARRIAVANATRPAAPLKVNLALTYWCQYRCRTCHIWKQRPTDELTTREVLAFIERNAGVSWLDITGGEIFLRRDIGEILDAVTSTWTSLALLHFPTNGFLTDRIVEAAERLGRRRGPVVIVTVSVDGPEALNDEVRGVAGGFRRQMETLRALRRIPGIRAVIGMTLSAYTAGRFEETFEACARECPGLTLDDFHLNVAQVSSHYYGNAGVPGIVPDSRDVIQDLRLYRARRGAPRTVSAWIEATYARHLESFLRTGQAPMRCHALRSSAFVDPWGTVFPCITYTRPLGSLRDTGMSLAPIWAAAETRQVQGEIWDGECPRCWTACEAYQSILGNLVRPAAPPGPRSRLQIAANEGRR